MWSFLSTAPPPPTTPPLTPPPPGASVFFFSVFVFSHCTIKPFFGQFWEPKFGPNRRTDTNSAERMFCSAPEHTYSQENMTQHGPLTLKWKLIPCIGNRPDSRLDGIKETYAWRFLRPRANAGILRCSTAEIDFWWCTSKLSSPHQRCLSIWIALSNEATEPTGLHSTPVRRLN